jgi:hypothetical protein
MALLDLALAAIDARGDSAVVMINHVVEVAAGGEVGFHELPSAVRRRG